MLVLLRFALRFLLDHQVKLNRGDHGDSSAAAPRWVPGALSTSSSRVNDIIGF